MGSGLYQVARNVEVLTMYQELLRKIAEEKPSYSQKELQWLLEHLGDSSPEIRDDLVFTSLARGIQEELFTKEQFQFISAMIVSDGGLDKELDKLGASTLDRSFRALIYANLLSADGNQHSLYYQVLKTDIRNTMLDQGLHYLEKEEDTTGFSSQYGWVHAFAHGADLLTEVVCHPDFPKNRVYEPILQGKLEQEQVASWIKAVDFPIEEREDFYKFSNFRSCLLEVYVQLDQRNSLQDDLKEAIQSFQY